MNYGTNCPRRHERTKETTMHINQDLEYSYSHTKVSNDPNKQSELVVAG